MSLPTIGLRRTAIVHVLSGITVLLVLLSVAGQLYLYLTPRESPWGWVGFLNVDMEMNLPTFWAVLLLLLGSALLALIAMLKHNERALYVLHWAILAFGFFVIASDEFFALHERLSEPMRRLLDWDTMGLFHFAWVIPAIVLVLGLAAFYYRFLMHLDRSTRVRLLLAGIVYLGGALGVEMIGGRYAEAHGTWNLTYSMITTVEESLELAGSLLLVDVLLRYLAATYGGVQLVFGVKEQGAS